MESIGTRSALTWAQRLSPLHHHPHLLLADLEPDHASAHWERIRVLHPGYAPAWIRLGLDLERDGNIPRASQVLTHAAAIDRTFLPQWTLANFYYRREQWSRFWSYARAAVSRYQGDLTGVYRLCLRVDDDPLRVLDRLGPTYPPARLDMMRFLLAQGRLADAARVAPLAASVNVRGTAGQLLKGCDQANARGDSASAVAFWNAASQNGWITRPALDPAAGKVIADGAFHHQPSGLCFDWRIPSQNGVIHHSGLPAGLRMDLSGLQAPNTVLARLWAPVVPRRQYRLSWRYGLEFSPNSATPVWRIAGTSTPPWADVRQGEEESILIQSGPSRLLELELAIPQAMGRTRPQGRLNLDWVRMQPVEAALIP